MECDFILWIRAAPEVADIDGEVTRLMDKEGLDICLRGRYLGPMPTEVVYYIRTSRCMLIKLKGRIDEFIHYEAFNLFEWRYW